MDGVLGVGVIGCGAVARRGHLPAYSAVSGVRVKAVADLRLSAARSVAGRFNVPGYFGDYRLLLEDPEIDVVSICTPSQTHVEIALAALRSGKHVFLEKPLALSLSEGREVVAEAERRGLKVCMGHIYRYYPVVREMVRVIGDGTLGRLVSVHGSALTHFPVGWTRGTWLYHWGGALDDFGPHLFDVLLWLNGPSRVDTVYAVGGDFLGSAGFVNYAEILVSFDSGCVATLDISWLTGSYLFKFDVHGTGGHVYVDVFPNHFVEIHGTQTPLDDLRSYWGRTSSLLRGIVSGKLFGGGMTYFKPLIEDFVESIRKDTPSPISARDGLRVVALTEAVKMSLTEHRPIKMTDLGVT